MEWVVSCEEIVERRWIGAGCFQEFYSPEKKGATPFSRTTQHSFDCQREAPRGSMAHLRNVLDINMPELDSLPLPVARGTRTTAAVDYRALANQTLHALVSQRTRGSQQLRVARNLISRADSLRFIRQLLADLQLNYTPGASSNEFGDPYSPGSFLPIPQTLQELVGLYRSFEEQHRAEQELARQGDIGSEEEESEDEGSDKEGSDDEDPLPPPPPPPPPSDSEEEDSDEDDQPPPPPPSPPRDIFKPEYQPPKWTNDLREVSTLVWVRYVRRGAKTNSSHYDMQIGPLLLSRAEYTTLRRTHVGGREERVALVESKVTFDDDGEGSFGDYRYDAGIVDSAYHAAVPHLNTGTPIESVGVRRPRKKAKAQGDDDDEEEEEPSELHHHFLGSGTKFGDSMHRLSYAEVVMLDHPFLTYSRTDLLRDEEVEPGNPALERYRIRDPYLRQHFIQNVCWMTHIIELVNTHTKRLQLTYESLWSIMGRPGLFDPVEAQRGLSVHDMIPVFDHFDREVEVFDMDRTVVYRRDRPPRGQGAKYVDVRPYTWRFLISEHHVYVLPGQNNVNMQSVFGWGKGYFAYGDAYEVMNT